MEEVRKEAFTNKEVNLLQRYRSRIKEIQEEKVFKNIINRQNNSLDFYKITPKDQLPIYLQKMKFQTLHLKQKDITNTLKIFKKENKQSLDHKLRKKIKESGRYMLLSEIYQNLGEPGIQPKKKAINNLEQPHELQQWQKTHKLSKGEFSQPRFAKDSKEIGSARGFRQGCDYKGQIERGLEIIDVTHGSQANLLNRYMLIQNSSKLLKKELQEKKIQIEENIKSRMKLLYEARTQYHTFFQQKNRLYLEQKVLKEESKDQIHKISHKSLSGKEKISKRSLSDFNQARIARTKKTIQNLEEVIVHLEQELKKLLQAEKLYFKITLKNGTDVRETGLVWVIQKLDIKESDIAHYDFPAYLDKKGKLFLIQKAQTDEEKEILLQQKRKFVNEIGRTNPDAKLKYRTLLNQKDYGASKDSVMQNHYRVDGDIPKKYRRSQRKMSALAEQFLQTSSLLDLRNMNRQVEISSDLDGLTNKEIYSQVGERIKKLDLSKIKRQKLGSKGARLLEYQSLLQKIKEAHIKEQDMDLQHENYLLSQYRDNRNNFFMQAAACFGYKKAYSMIIKHYSWKNYNDQTLVKRKE